MALFVEFRNEINFNATLCLVISPMTPKQTPHKKINPVQTPRNEISKCILTKTNTFKFHNCQLMFKINTWRVCNSLPSSWIHRHHSQVLILSEHIVALNEPQNWSSNRELFQSFVWKDVSDYASGSFERKKTQQQKQRTHKYRYGVFFLFAWIISLYATDRHANRWLSMYGAIYFFSAYNGIHKFHFLCMHNINVQTRCEIHFFSEWMRLNSGYYEIKRARHIMR